ncbi:tRNA-dependent cyclodipeptide synthase [Streptomyces sp. NPDC004059]
MTASTTDVQAGGLVASPLSATCAEILSQADHACIGVSPFNSFFSVGRIRQLAEWAYGRFARVDFFIPDGPSAYTLQALGYPPQRAEWKARRQGQYTRNRISSALRDLAAGADDSRILGWAELQVDAAFVRLHAEVRALYEQDEGFRTACRETSSWVLADRLPDGRRPDEHQVDWAVRYFLAELPLFVDTPAIVGTEASVFCYHWPPPLLYRLYQRELACHPAPGQGFVVITSPGARPAKPQRQGAQPNSTPIHSE